MVLFLGRFSVARPIQQFLGRLARTKTRQSCSPSSQTSPSPESGGCSSSLTSARTSTGPGGERSHSSPSPPNPPHATLSLAWCRKVWQWSAFLAVGLNLIRHRWALNLDQNGYRVTPEGIWPSEIVPRLSAAFSIVPPIGKKAGESAQNGRVPEDEADSWRGLPLEIESQGPTPFDIDSGSLIDEGWRRDAGPSSPDLDQAERELWASGQRLLARMEGLKAMTQFDRGHWATGLKHLARAAQMGDAESQHNLGYVYEMGLGGVAVDLQRAWTWYREAAQQDYAASVYNVGVFYESGVVVPQDLKKAQVLFQRAQELERDSESPMSTQECHLCRENHWSSSDSEDATVNKKNDPESIYLLARAYQYGLSGIQADSFFALELYREAAKLGYLPAKDAFQALLVELKADQSGKKGLLHSTSLPNIQESESMHPMLAMKSSQSLETLNSLTEEESAIFLY